MPRFTMEWLERIQNEMNQQNVQPVIQSQSSVQPQQNNGQRFTMEQLERIQAEMNQANTNGAGNNPAPEVVKPASEKKTTVPKEDSDREKVLAKYRNPTLDTPKENYYTQKEKYDAKKRKEAVDELVPNLSQYNREVNNERLRKNAETYLSRDIKPEELADTRNRFIGNMRRQGFTDEEARRGFDEYMTYKATAGARENLAKQKKREDAIASRSDYASLSKDLDEYLKAKDNYDAMTSTSVSPAEMYRNMQNKYRLSDDELSDIILTYNKKKQNEGEARGNAMLSNYGKEHPVLGSLASTGLNVVQGMEAIPNVASGIFYGDDRRINNSMASSKRALREGVKQNINSKGGQFAYDLGMGAGDFLADTAAAAITGGAVNPAVLMALNSADEAQMEALERGADTRNASMGALAQGGVSYLMNKKGLDVIKDSLSTSTINGAKDILRNVGVGALTEGLENVTEDSINTVVDGLINGNNSALNNTYYNYIMSGMDSSEALLNTAKDFGMQMAQSAGSGALFGAGFAGVGSAKQIPRLLKSNANNNIADMDSATLQRTLMEGNNQLLNQGRAMLGEEPIDLPTMSDGRLTDEEVVNLVNGMDNPRPEDVQARYEAQARINESDNITNRGVKTTDINTIRQQIDNGDYETAYNNINEAMSKAQPKEYMQFEDMLKEVEGHLDLDNDLETRIELTREMLDNAESVEERNFLRNELEDLEAEANRTRLAEEERARQNNTVMAEDTGIGDTTVDPTDITDSDVNDSLEFEEEYVPYGQPAKAGAITESRGITHTAKENDLYRGLVKQETDDLSSHEIQSNEKTFNEAYESVSTEEGVRNFEHDIIDGKVTMGDSAVDMTKGVLVLHDLASQYDEAVANGDTAKATELNIRRTRLLRKFKESTEEVGRTLQSLRMWSHSKEGAELAAEKVRNERTQEWLDSKKGRKKDIENLSSKLLYAFNKLVEPEKAQVEGRRLNLDEHMEEVTNTINAEMSSFAKHFTDDDVRYIANLLNNGITKEELADFVATKMATGSFGLSKETMDEVNRLFEENTNYNVNSKQFVENETEAYRLIANEVCAKSSLIEKFDAWRYLAMLGNPKTMVRNAIGNKLFGSITNFSDNIAAVGEEGIDKFAKKVNKGQGIERHKAVLTSKDSDLISRATNDADESRYRQLNGDKYHNGVKKDLMKNKDVWDSRFMRGVEKLTEKGLSDYKSARKKYGKALARYLKANGLDASVFDAESRYSMLDAKVNRGDLLSKTERAEYNSLNEQIITLQKARDFAQKEAEYAVFHEDNAFASALSKFSNSNQVAHVIVEGLLPFKKTPANILRSGAEYSPLGIFKSLNDTRKFIRDLGKEDTYTKTSKITGKTKSVDRIKAADVIDSWAKTFTGSTLTLLGAYLFDKGILHSSKDDEKYQDQLEGLQNYSLNIGGWTGTIDFLAPAVMPLLVGAEWKRAMDNGGFSSEEFWSKENIGQVLNNSINVASSILQPIMDTSMLEGVSDTLGEIGRATQNNEDANPLGTIAWNIATGYLTQTMPTIAGQTARTLDNTRRSTYSNQESVARTIDRQLTKLRNKTPFLSMTGEAYVDSRGNTQRNGFDTGNKVADTLANTAYQFLSPTYISKVNTTDADKLAREVYEATGSKDNSVFADLKTNKKINTYDEAGNITGSKKLDKADYTTYSTVKGKANDTLRNMFASDERVNNMPVEEKAYVLKQINALSDKIGEANVDENYSTTNSVYSSFVTDSYEGALNTMIEDAHTENLNSQLTQRGISRNDITREMLDNGDEAGLEKYGTAEKIAEEFDRKEITKKQWNVYKTYGENAFRKELNYEKAAKQYKVTDTKDFRKAYDSNDAMGYARAWKAITSTPNGVDEYGEPKYLEYSDTTRKIFKDSGVQGLREYVEALRKLEATGLDKKNMVHMVQQDNLAFVSKHTASQNQIYADIQSHGTNVGDWLPVLRSKKNISTNLAYDIIYAMTNGKVDTNKETKDMSKAGKVNYYLYTKKLK